MIIGSIYRQKRVFPNYTLSLSQKRSYIPLTCNFLHVVLYNRHTIYAAVNVRCEQYKWVGLLEFVLIWLVILGRCLDIPKVKYASVKFFDFQLLLSYISQSYLVNRVHLFIYLIGLFYVHSIIIGHT